MSKRTGKLISVGAVDIHGARFYDITVMLNGDPPRTVTSRIGQESVYPNPQEGDAVTVHLVLSQITCIEQAI